MTGASSLKVNDGVLKTGQSDLKLREAQTL
jgi:hypothetical protein